MVARDGFAPRQRTLAMALGLSLPLLLGTPAAVAVAACGGSLVVTNTADSGLGSLRDAINYANCLGGTQTITFNITGPGVQTIFPLSNLPTLEESLLVPVSITIDGYSQPGSSPNTLSSGDNAVLLIQIDGSDAGGIFNTPGLIIVGSHCVIKGLVISNFTGPGIFDVSGSYGVGQAVIQGNFIGTTPSGMAAAGNFGGVFTFDFGPTIGGTDPAARNVISGNTSDGVTTFYSGGVVRGNLIGTDSTGLGNLGNGGDGVRIIEETDNLVGGIAPGAGNVIAFNGGGGVVLRCSEGCPTGSAILGNSIFSNAGLGISLGGASPVPNDDCDADSGANDQQNYPVLTLAEILGSTTLIEGTLNSQPDTVYRVELFASPACDPSAHGQGRTFLGATAVGLGGCNGSFSLTIPMALAAGQVVTATATAPNNDTSEFSACLPVTNGTCTQVAPPPALIVDKPIAPVDAVVTLTWDAPFRGFPGTYTVRFSMDGGVTFQDFAAGIRGSQFAFHVQYPAGTTLVFEVVADPGCGPAGVSDPSPTVTVQVVQACPRAGDPVAQVDQVQVAVGDFWSLHWTATLPVVGGVTAGVYEIRISRDNGATFQVAGTTTGTTFTGPVLPEDLGKLIFLQVVAKPPCSTGSLSYGGSNTVFFTVLPGPGCEAPQAARSVSVAAAGVSPPRPPSPIEYILASWLSPAGGTAPTRYGVRINGDPDVLTTFTSLILPPRGGRDPITAFVTAYTCGTLISAEVFAGAGTWSPTGSLGVPRQSHTATPLPGGKVLVAGGTSTPFGPAIASVEIFDPGTGDWSPTANLMTARQSHTATALSNGKVLVSGGVSAGLAASGVFQPVTGDIRAEAQLSSSELYDPAAKTWSTTGDLGTPRAQHTATLLLNGKVLVAGGRGGGPLNTAELYDPTTGLWSSTGQLQAARLAHTATLLPNGKVLVAGGVSASGVLASAELYDPSTGAWTPTGSLGTAREGQTATLLSSSSKVLVSGGDDGGAALKGAELYDPAAGTWSATGSLGAARTLHTATLLPGGAVLAAGGSVLHGPSLKSAELYDPAAGTWRATGSLNGAHGLHSATLLSSGSVLLAGLPDSIGPERASPTAQSSTVALFLTPPGTDFTISPNPVVGQPVTFTDTSNPQATDWLWIFDDGTTDSRQSPTHVFTGAGTHTVALDATNGAGSQTKVKSFVVSAAALATASRQSESVAFDASDPVRQRATVALGAQGSTWLHVMTRETQDTTLFLRFIGKDGALETERRLVASPGAEAVYDLAAWGLKGTFSVEIVCDRSFSAWIVRTGRPGTKEITR